MMLVSICDKSFDSLFRLPGASNHRGIQRFLFQVAVHYKERVEFLTDLLKVGSPELFVVCQTESGERSREDDTAVCDFKQELRKFISENKLKNQLLHQMKEILVRNICMYYLHTLEYVSSIQPTTYLVPTPYFILHLVTENL